MWGGGLTRSAAGSAPGDGELCLIDAGLQLLSNLSLHPGLCVLNLHCNLVKNIENLLHLRSLRHLDLSSNQITTIKGLDGLLSLRTLNLACNHIQKVQGLENLRSLVKINLSFNLIHDLKGFHSLQGLQYHLEHIEIHGNRLTTADHVISCLMGLTSLQSLTLSHGGADNPVCQTTGYREVMLAGLTQLHVLDNVDRSGQATAVDDVLADIPGLDQYLEYLVSTNGSTDTSPVVALATPRIDAALEIFKTKEGAAPLTSTTDPDTSTLDTPPRKCQGQKTSGERLQKLENQLAELLNAAKKSSSSSDMTPVKVICHRPSRTDQTDESDADTSGPDTGRRVRGQGRRGRRSHIPEYQQSTAASRRRSRERTKQSPDVQKQRSTARSPPGGARSHVTSDAGVKERPRNVVMQPAASVLDEQRKDEMRDTYLELMAELEKERERRWKSEQASKKLVEHIQQLQSRVREDHEVQETAVEATGRLKGALTKERDIRTQMAEEIKELKHQVEQLKEDLAVTNQREAEVRSSMTSLQDTAAAAQREALQQQSHDARKVQEAQLRAAAVGRELDLVRNSVKTLKGQVQQLQQLLADREQEHRKQMEGLFGLNSKEFLEAVHREVSKEETRHSDDIRIQQQKVSELTRQYSELEDEFRMALQIESSRFQELQEEYERLSREHAHKKHALEGSVQKETKSSTLVSELTALVKEQKGRLTELARSKQEQIVEFKERISGLEAHVEEARKRMVTLELLKQEKVRLMAQVSSQESVIEGLKAERKLWGEELAQQGASLSQDRGRLEAKIETLSSETATLRRQLEKETDSVKIKTKMIEDQTETIRKLKEAVLERDEAVRLARDESLQNQRDLEEQLAAERDASAGSQERLERLRERKEELKSEVSDLQHQLNETKKSLSNVNSKWREKSGVIEELEHRVSKMKMTWDEKESRLSAERDKAVDAARLAVEKLKSMDAAFRQQLEAKEFGRQEALARLSQDKQEEIEAANRRVLEVEDEMRLLLRENETNKRAMEERMKKLNQVFSELRDDVL